ncbi:MAG: hypothetical protein IPI11_10895 [Haliscomenobacter sp.]|nr:hypothetical protein [Haliscomenobacter sp.]
MTDPVPVRGSRNEPTPVLDLRRCSPLVWASSSREMAPWGSVQLQFSALGQAELGFAGFQVAGQVALHQSGDTEFLHRAGHFAPGSLGAVVDPGKPLGVAGADKAVADSVKENGAPGIARKAVGKHASPVGNLTGGVPGGNELGRTRFRRFVVQLMPRPGEAPGEDMDEESEFGQPVHSKPVEMTKYLYFSGF